ncbi:L-threonylcarbamoyladenylate synthase [Candidatus Venteria ishoeyi]|uniref:Threonylcarbamoyl-AMP synthase n=1 Tax=Candidatus Venteria ishoeyi TaxID=1899563 RepID=A0A1H6F6F1_9GAMM|nr:L-threonylcarbamoyladenylate synthase [Candidatus Venteria ishoeyi]MDM8546075.1 L-threonylcarbamoyladenylate synthase [Candidatus Venteria ishoeyi]SEH05730.1 Threonylcarbamoyl-AMP synthase [Candidatus Venteria ishoeyi]
MAPLLHIHPDNPQVRLVRQVVEVIRSGGLVVYPTDSSYALGCHIGDKNAMERIRRLRAVDNSHNFTLVCRDLSELSLYAKVHNQAFRLMKSLSPGPYTFILKATHEVPKRLQNPKRKTIGLRVPDNAICHEILAQLNEPIMSSTLILPGKDMPETDPEEIYDKIGKHVDMIVDGGACGLEATTVLDLLEETPQVMRRGCGPTDLFE